MNNYDALEEKPWIADHRRDFLDFRFVYPVISRRSGGLSLGINLNQNHHCNFRCQYCQVEGRSNTPESDNPVWLEVLEGELRSLLQMIEDGKLWLHPRFESVPENLRTLKDIAIAGNGEPALSPLLPKVLLKLDSWHQRGEFNSKVILISNGTRLGRPEVVEALKKIQSMQLELWLKMDTTDPEQYKVLHQSPYQPKDLLRNLKRLPSHFTLRLQTMLTKFGDQEPVLWNPESHVEMLREIRQLPIELKELQLLTMARSSADHKIYPVTKRELTEAEFYLRTHCPDLNVQVYG